jgi:hypothetical protein
MPHAGEAADEDGEADQAEEEHEPQQADPLSASRTSQVCAHAHNDALAACVIVCSRVCVCRCVNCVTHSSRVHRVMFNASCILVVVCHACMLHQMVL